MARQARPTRTDRMHLPGPDHPPARSPFWHRSRAGFGHSGCIELMLLVMAHTWYFSFAINIARRLAPVTGLPVSVLVIIPLGLCLLLAAITCFLRRRKDGPVTGVQCFLTAHLFLLGLDIIVMASLVIRALIRWISS